MPKNQQHSEEDLKKHNAWQVHIKDWQTSQLTASMYCRNHQLNIHQFKYWQYRFAPETRRQKTKEVLFSQVQIEQSTPPRIIQSETSTTNYFELCIRDDIKLRLPMQFDTASLKRLLDCLGVN